MPKERKLPEWTGLPLQRSSAAALRARLLLVSGLLLLAVLSGVASTLAWLTSGAAGGQAPAPVRVEPVGRAVATIAAEAYVSGVEPVGLGLAGEAVFSSDGISVLSGPVWASWAPLEINGAPFEQHSFDLFRRVDGEATAYRLVVLVSIDPRGASLPSIAAAPSLRRLPSARADGRSLPAGRDDVQAPVLPVQARDRLTLWAAAWAAGDAEALKVFTGDPTPDVTYLGLGGYSVSNLSILSAVQVDERWLVRLRIVLDDPLLGGFSASGHRITTDLDVTVEAASSGNPRVVGWGQAGSGIRLPGSVREPSPRR